MEIYKLKDFEKIEDADSASVELRITDIRQAVKNENRVNVFVNNEYSFSLDISQVVDMHVKKGMVLSTEQLEEYKKASEFGKLYQRTLEWVLARPHSEREVRDYLYRKLKTSSSGRSLRPSSRGSSLRPRSDCGCPSEDVSELSNKIISKLLSKGYIDDTRFAQYYVENRFVKKGVSQKRLAMELAKKGVAREIIDSVLDVRNDEEEIKKIIAKKRAKYDDEKLIQYLCQQGFDYQLTQEIVRSCGTD